MPIPTAMPAKKKTMPKKQAKPSLTASQPLSTNAVISKSVHTKPIPTETRRVLAYSVRHAKMVAAAMFGIPEEFITDCKMVVNPGKATMCENADFPQRGTRQWVTEYQIFTYAERVAVGLNKFDYIGVELVKGGFAEKTPAVKEAKKLCLKYNVPMMVQIAKVLDKDDPATMICEPKTTKGDYLITYAPIGLV